MMMNLTNSVITSILIIFHTYITTKQTIFSKTWVGIIIKTFFNIYNTLKGGS